MLDGHCRLNLDKALRGGKPLSIYLDCRAGRIANAMGLSPDYNQSSHEVDASGMQLNGNEIKGEVRVKIHPDIWTPKSGTVVNCRYAIDAVVSRGGVSGAFTGEYGNGSVASRPSAGTHASHQ